MKKGKTDKLTALMEKRIHNGDWPVGEYIPPMRTIAEDEGVSRSVVAAALSILVGKGYLECVPRQGYMVRRIDAVDTKKLIKEIVAENGDEDDIKRLFIESCAEMIKNGTGGSISPEDRQTLVKYFGSILYDRNGDSFVGDTNTEVAAYSSDDELITGWPTEKYSIFECNVTRETSKLIAGTLIKFNFNPEDGGFDRCTMNYLQKRVHPNDANAYISLMSRENLLDFSRSGDAETGLEYREGVDESSMHWVRLTVRVSKSPTTFDVIAKFIFQDIDDEKRHSIQQKERIGEDSLTGVLSRKAFILQAEELIANSKSDSQHAFLMLDVDGFKVVNDQFGHPTGDKVLTDIAKGIRSVLRHGDLVGRIGGDEFMICLKNIPFDPVIEKRGEQINALMRRSFDDGTTISGSIGVAIYPRDGHAFDDLYRKADVALYCAKDAGKDRVVFYKEGMQRGSDNLVDVPETHQTEVAHARKRKVLIVDDVELNRVMLAEMLKEDYTILQASDGKRALMTLRRYGVAISAVLLDLTMPVMSGFEVLKAIQREPIIRSVPVIVVSGSEDAADEFEAIKLGAMDFVRKPVDPRLIKIRVGNAVNKLENDRLRVQNSYLQLQGDEQTRYRYIIESTATIVIEHDWVNGVFVYDKNISKYLSGNYDSRPIWRILLSDMIASTKDVREFQELIYHLANNREQNSNTLKLRLKTVNGEKHWFRMNAYKMVDDFQLANKILITLNDINDEVVATEKLRRIAEYDSMTDIYNRTAFLSHVKQLIGRHAPGSYIMCYADIDGFNRINDLYGHTEGSILLKYVAEHMRVAMGDFGVCARISGDIFAMLFPNREDIIDRLRNSYESSVSREKLPYDISMTFGLYVIDDVEMNPEVMMDCACAAHDSVKGNATRRFAYYESELKKKNAQEKRTLKSVDAALRDKQFEVYFQPVVDYDTHKVVSAEALVRWNNPTEGLLTPSDFISILERNGLVAHMDNYVWESTCAMLRSWIDKYGSSVPVSFNLSSVNIYNTNLIETISALCEKYRISPSLIRFEINENTYTSNPEHLSEIIKRLQDKGFIVEIDDFGSGYSSLNMLSDIPVDALKLDMRYIDNVRNSKVIKHIVDMAACVNLDVTASGVESAEQAEYLQSIGCEKMQGFYFAKPMNSRDFENILANPSTDATAGTMR